MSYDIMANIGTKIVNKILKYISVDYRKRYMDRYGEKEPIKTKTKCSCHCHVDVTKCGCCCGGCHYEVTQCKHCTELPKGAVWAKGSI